MTNEISQQERIETLELYAEELPERIDLAAGISTVACVGTLSCASSSTGCLGTFSSASTVSSETV